MQTILYFIEVSCPGGAQNVLLNILDGLNRSKYRPIVALLEKGWLEETLRSKGYEVIIVNSTNKSFDWRLIKDLLSICKKNKVKLIHAHLFDSGIYASIVGLLARTPVAITLHGQVDWKKSSYPVIDKIKLIIINSIANHIIYVSENLKKYYEELGVKKRKGIRIYNGINLDQFVPLPKEDIRLSMGFSYSDILMGSVGHVRPWRGYEFLIDAAEMVVKLYPKARFIIVGNTVDENYYQRLVSKVNKKKLQNNILFLGFRTNIREILSALDLFVLPSISEGFSLVTVEAMAAGKPVVGTNSGGPAEIVDDGVTGYMVPPADSGALAEKILVLLKDYCLAESMGKAGHLRAEERFSLERMIDNYHALYEKSLVRNE